ncbi:MAG TPA: hypothetical protein VD947_02940 [Patescibacteria group bacterium]|nr:hypothetical protein [Patescibacteria group bacterium]
MKKPNIETAKEWVKNKLELDRRQLKVAGGIGFLATAVAATATNKFGITEETGLVRDIANSARHFVVGYSGAWLGEKRYEETTGKIVEGTKGVIGLNTGVELGQTQSQEISFVPNWLNGTGESTNLTSVENIHDLIAASIGGLAYIGLNVRQNRGRSPASLLQSDLVPQPQES